jgi:hypothetical protein
MASASGLAGPYSMGIGDSGNPYDAPVPGFVGPHGDGKCGDDAPNNYVNPEFIGWASGYQNYLPADTQWSGDWDDPTKALGEVTGDHFDIVSLGDLDADEIANNDPPGEITLMFEKPIRNGVGKDFVLFENGFYSEWTTPEGSVEGEIFAELGYVRISTDGSNWLTFASDSLTPEPSGSYGYLTIDPTDAYNMIGKHANAYGESWGTPFDLDEFADNQLVIDGLVDLNQIKYVKIVDIPGSGDFLDASGDPIYDAWITWGSGGLDLEAAGILNELPDFDGDGDVDGDDIDILRASLGSADRHYDLNNDGDSDSDDFSYMVENCLQWSSGLDGGYGTAAGDFNLDGVIDTTDLTILSTSFSTDPAGWALGNANSDTIVNTTDLTILSTNFGFSAGGGQAAPEPTSLCLMLAGGLAALKRRKR